MRILFDQGTPAPLRKWLTGHAVSTAYEEGWDNLQNGDLISRAEACGCDLFITTDQNLEYQQNLGSRKIAIHVLSTTSWPRIRKHVDAVSAAVAEMKPGEFRVITIPS